MSRRRFDVIITLLLRRVSTDTSGDVINHRCLQFAEAFPLDNRITSFN